MDNFDFKDLDVVENDGPKKKKEVVPDTRPPFLPVKIYRNRHILIELFKMIQKDGFICGGFARYCCSPHALPIPSDDIDIYCNNEEGFKNLSTRFGEADDYEKGKENEVSITFKKENFPRVQLIKTLKTGHVVLLGTPIEVIDNFDFTISRVAITSPRRAVADKDFIEHELRKKLVIRNIHCPLAEIYRVTKYVHKGYWIGTDQTLKIFADWDIRTPEYKEKLVELLNQEDMSEEDIDQLEKLLHID